MSAFLSNYVSIYDFTSHYSLKTDWRRQAPQLVERAEKNHNKRRPQHVSVEARNHLGYIQKAEARGNQNWVYSQIMPPATLSRPAYWGADMVLASAKSPSNVIRKHQNNFKKET